MKEYREEFFKGERALFAVDGAKIYDCIFDDGESPLKESKNIEVYNSINQKNYCKESHIPSKCILWRHKNKGT